MNLLFLYGRAPVRSPTAERALGDVPGVETRAAGVSVDAEVPVSADDVTWANVIACTEREHAGKPRKKVGKSPRGKCVVVLGIQEITPRCPTTWSPSYANATRRG